MTKDIENANKIIKNAKKQAKRIIAEAEAKAQKMVSESELMKRIKIKAERIKAELYKNKEER